MKFIDLRQSENYGRYMEKIGWRVVKYQIARTRSANWPIATPASRDSKQQAFIKRIPFLPVSIIKIQRPREIDWMNIDEIAKKYHAIFVNIEPLQITNYQLLITNGYKPNKSPLLPTKTLHLDLTPPIDDIFSQFSKETRYEVRKAEKNNLKIITSSYLRHCEERAIANDVAISKDCFASLAMTDDTLISSFISLWQENAWSRGFWLPLKKEIRSIYESFGKNAFLILAYSQTAGSQQIFEERKERSDSSQGFVPQKIPVGDLSSLPKETKPIAGALIIINDKIAYYFHAASSSQGRQLSAPSLTVWEAIKLAKSKGCQTFDFEGIYDPRFPNKSWMGFSHFKKGFGGKEIEYPGCFTKYYNPLSYLFSR